MEQWHWYDYAFRLFIILAVMGSGIGAYYSERNKNQ